MIKKIHVSQVRIGMHLHSMEGAWMDHPFWKTRFKLKTAKEIQLLMASTVREVWIDLSKGLDVDPANLPPEWLPTPAASPEEAQHSGEATAADVAVLEERQRTPPGHCGRSPGQGRPA